MNVSLNKVLADSIRIISIVLQLSALQIGETFYIKKRNAKVSFIANAGVSKGGRLVWGHTV